MLVRAPVVTLIQVNVS